MNKKKALRSGRNAKKDKSRKITATRNNKIRKLKKHLRKHENDPTAIAALKFINSK